MSSHVMALFEQLCDHVAVIDRRRVAAAGTLEQAREGGMLEAAFSELAGAASNGVEGLSWLTS